MNQNQTQPKPEGAEQPSPEGLSSSALLAAERLEGLAERWEETEVWHDPPFLDGRINITTGELRDISTVVRFIQANSQDRAPA
jgi:hypothetical protein